ncbi:5,6-dimethylbenzimidazole synthase [Methylobacterium haplocladii]|uniref:5,6-dimethylbenzimidazole synthase n=1 Tax=Methylobacterium haplocladii TaxID=1176176 RepID=A0A512ILX4_9HYPH|nr:5,6-dimethylbenzimidazole synthase [Methylobacterium haplocladii]GEO98723.1 5,6-dimethylbenzimidazole synthase [Methylobacterium haplocladii]GJD85809.1 5,6-dimethylbenzimidazole synthase [Methylobacterium haplocladii]GLS57627.1 5,6-dimethylbenzimidazole synthase [Methylobacterium haplocladii]
MPPDFDAAFRDRLAELFAWRRDVRRFRDDPVDETVLSACLALASLAPSVGNSQPWRFVRVADPSRRAAVVASFSRCNAAACASYADERRELYASLKLEGLREAPVHLAVFCDEATETGYGLGRETMPEMLRYSAVTAVHTFWLAARAHGLGVGWVSILEPEVVTGLLDVPAAWRLIAYLCVGQPMEAHSDPELVRHSWQARSPASASLTER